VAHTSIDEQGDRLSSSTEIELLRIAQEALTNVRKHARAGQVWITCTIDAPHAYLVVSDDGVGVQGTRPGSMGLQGMRERARRIGGVLDVRPRDGGGTVVEVRLGQPAISRPERPPGGLARAESIA
jgi:signal transduction histidine kinase